MREGCAVSTFKRRYEASALVRPIRNSSTSKRPLYSTTVSKIRSIKCESIKWPSASTTSCCMGNSQDSASPQMDHVAIATTFKLINHFHVGLMFILLRDNDLR